MRRPPSRLLYILLLVYDRRLDRSPRPLCSVHPNRPRPLLPTSCPPSVFLTNTSRTVPLTIAYKRLTYLVPIRLRVLAAAEVAQRPRRIAQHRQLVVLAQQHQERLEGTRGEDVVSALGRVAGNVAQCPDTGISVLVSLGSQQTFRADMESGSLAQPVRRSVFHHSSKDPTESERGRLTYACSLTSRTLEARRRTK